MIDEHGGGASRTTDPAAGTSTATDVSLREYTEARISTLGERIDALRREMILITESAEQAIRKAETAVERRFEGVNEFRAQLADQATHFATRDQVDALDEKFRALYERNRSEIDLIWKRVDQREGETVGSRRTQTALYAALGAAVAFISLVVILANIVSSR